MEDVLYQALVHGDSVIAWLGAALAGLVAKYVLTRIDNEKVRKYATRAWTEVKDAVAEVYQTYVSALKEANADGKLTPEEAAEARKKAIAIAKANIGKKGLARLSRILGLNLGDEIEAWLGTKVEAAVTEAKTTGGGAPGPLPSGTP